MEEFFFNIKVWVIPFLSIVATTFTLFTAINSLRVTVKKKDNKEKSTSIDPETQISEDSDLKHEFEKDSRISFEAMKLSEYYSQVLSQSKISFWFSLIFASIGFTVILLGAFTFVQNNIGSSVVTMISGVIIDSISALFFVQSKSAQKSMSEFFEKLRLDRGISDSKEICETISDHSTKDALKVQLALHLAGISESIIIAKNIADNTKNK